jgi:hypothetical protein
MKRPFTYLAWLLILLMPVTLMASPHAAISPAHCQPASAPAGQTHAGHLGSQDHEVPSPEHCAHQCHCAASCSVPVLLSGIASANLQNVASSLTPASHWRRRDSQRVSQPFRPPIFAFS